jgi:hypothetical protein
VPEDELRLDVKNFIPDAAKVAVATGVGRAAEPMVPAINFDDEPQGRGEEVGDGVAEDDLAAEWDAEPAGRECGPEAAFGFRGRAAVRLSARGEKVRASGGW